MKASEPSVIQKQTCSLQPNLTGHLLPRGYHSGYVLQHPETYSILKPLLELGFIGRFRMCWARSVYKHSDGEGNPVPTPPVGKGLLPFFFHWGQLQILCPRTGVGSGRRGQEVGMKEGSLTRGSIESGTFCTACETHLCLSGWSLMITNKSCMCSNHQPFQERGLPLANM